MASVEEMVTDADTWLILSGITYWSSDRDIAILSLQDFFMKPRDGYWSPPRT